MSHILWVIVFRFLVLSNLSWVITVLRILEFMTHLLWVIMSKSTFADWTFSGLQLPCHYRLLDLVVLLLRVAQFCPEAHRDQLDLVDLNCKYQQNSFWKLILSVNLVYFSSQQELRYNNASIKICDTENQNGKISTAKLCHHAQLLNKDNLFAPLSKVCISPNINQSNETYTRSSSDCEANFLRQIKTLKSAESWNYPPK